MPQIAQFTSPIDSLRPSETGAESVARGQRIIQAEATATSQEVRQGFHDLGTAIEDHETQTAVLAGHAALNKATLEAQDALNQTAQNADLSDPKVLSQVQQSVGQRFDDIASQFSTTNRATMAIGEAAMAHKQHFFETSAAAGSIAAAQKAQTDIVSSVNDLGNVVAQSPGSLPFAYQQIDQQIAGVISANPRMGADTIAKLRGEFGQQQKKAVTQAWAEGLINHNPGAAAAIFNKGEGEWTHYMSGSEAAAKAIQAVKLNHTLAMQGQAAAREEARFQYDQAFNQVTNAIYDAKTPEDLQKVYAAGRAVTQMRGAPAGAAENLIRFSDQRREVLATGQDIRDNSETLTDLFNKGAAGTLTLDYMHQQIAAGNLNPKTSQSLKSIFDVTKNDMSERLNLDAVSRTITGYKDAITEPYKTAMQPAMGEQQFLNFQVDVASTIQKGLAAGNTIKDMVQDPRNQFYIGNLAQKYVVDRTNPDQMRNLLSRTLNNSLTPAPTLPSAPGIPTMPAQSLDTPRTTGENADDFLRRVTRLRAAAAGAEREREGRP